MWLNFYDLPNKCQSSVSLWCLWYAKQAKGLYSEHEGHHEWKLCEPVYQTFISCGYENCVKLWEEPLWFQWSNTNWFPKECPLENDFRRRVDAFSWMASDMNTKNRLLSLKFHTLFLVRKKVNHMFVIRSSRYVKSRGIRG